MKELNIDFKKQGHVFIQTPTEEQYNYLYDKLLSLNLKTSSSRDSGQSTNSEERIIYISSDNPYKFGGYNLPAYKSGYKSCHLYSFEEFTKEYGLEKYNIEMALADAEKSIEEMEARLMIKTL